MLTRAFFNELQGCVGLDGRDGPCLRFARSGIGPALVNKDRRSRVLSECRGLTAACSANSHQVYPAKSERLLFSAIFSLPFATLDSARKSSQVRCAKGFLSIRLIDRQRARH